MVRYQDAMIDIETLATTPKAHVLSIGVVGFTRDSDDIDQGLHVALAFDQKREIDPNTVAWWMKQAPAAQEGAFSGQCPVLQALKDVATYFSALDPSVSTTCAAGRCRRCSCSRLRRSTGTATAFSARPSSIACWRCSSRRRSTSRARSR